VNTLALKISGAKNWHDKGYTGKGVTIAVLDGFEMSDIIKPYDASLESTHGLNVCKSALVTAPDANIIMLKWKGAGCDKTRCVTWIKENNPDLINISQGGNIIQARDFPQFEGFPMFCASGNSAKDIPDYPARYDFTLAVGAWNHWLNKVASYSSRGEDIFGLNPYIPNARGEMWAPMGTSFACPFAVGLMACYLQWAKERGQTLTTEQIYEVAKANKNEYGILVLPDSEEGIQMNNPKYVIIHHSATTQGDVASFRRAHKAKGWRDVGYHYVINNGTYQADGLVEVGRTEYEDGAHCKADGMNRKSIGICLVGDLNVQRPTTAQMESLKQLCRDIMSRYRIPAGNILGHGEVKGSATACPGKNFDMKKLRGRLEVPEVKIDYKGHWAESSIQKVKNEGLMSGYPDGSFKPDQKVTRAELATALARLIERS